jgi:hypothetical protein
MNNNEDYTLTIKPRPSETVSIKIPLDTLEQLQQIANNRNMSVESLIRFYIGKNLREEISQQFSNKLMNSTLKVLAKHISSESQRQEIIQEIKSELK